MAHEVFTLSELDLETGKSNVDVRVEGNSKMPFDNHDLKVKAILALLDSIDIKQYYENNLQEEGFKAAEEIINSTKAAFGLDLFE